MPKTILFLISSALVVFSGWYLSGTVAAGPYHTLKRGVTLNNGVTLSVPSAAFSCGSGLEKTHTTGDGVCPVTKTVTYGTVQTSLSGASKCWITQNLGADNQASGVDDSTEASAGWYWQFNRKQGYKHDGATLTPSWGESSIEEDSDWTSANDPCTILLGAGWRLPTSTEWTAADSGWSTWADAWGSDLKLHAAGFLDRTNGALYYRGSRGYYWSGAQYSSTHGYYLRFYGFVSTVYRTPKANGFSVRCLKD